MYPEAEIVKARFFIEPKQEHNRVQHIGCRLVITEKMIHAHFKKGMVFNLPDGTVEVALEGNKKDIDAFYNNLKKNLITWLKEKSKNPKYLEEMIGNPGINLTDLEYKPTLRILSLDLFSHSLEMDQLNKGVDIYYELTKAIKDLGDTNKDLRDTLKSQKK